MLDLLVIIYLGYRNSLIAKRKGKNGLAWIFLTILAYYIGAVIGSGIILGFFYKGDLDAFISLSKTNPQAFSDQVIQFFYQPIRMIFIFLCGLGGYLFIRYILEKKPDINKGKSNGVEGQ